MAMQQISFSVPATPTAVSAIRRRAVAGIRGWRAQLDEDTLHTAELLISELVTNSIQHAGTDRVSLLVHLTDRLLRIEVHDASPDLPHPGHPDLNSENGRGLLLIAALAARHGTDPTETGKCCWAELTLPTPADRPDLHPPSTTVRHDEASAACAPARSVEGTPLPPPRSQTKIPDAPVLRAGYWCECWTEDLDVQRRPALLASVDAYSAAQADRWVAVALRTITPALDSQASEEAWDWLYEGRIETRRALLRAKPCTVSITQGRTRITWTIRPVLFAPFAHRNGVELPACPYDFKPWVTVSSLS